MNIKYSDLRDKILGCWNGKNIGGVLGAPYEECQRSLHDVKFYQQDLNGNPPGNDDLDLQLVCSTLPKSTGKSSIHIFLPITGWSILCRTGPNTEWQKEI